MKIKKVATSTTLAIGITHALLIGMHEYCFYFFHSHIPRILTPVALSAGSSDNERCCQRGDQILRAKQQQERKKQKPHPTLHSHAKSESKGRKSHAPAWKANRDEHSWESLCLSQSNSVWRCAACSARPLLVADWSRGAARRCCRRIGIKGQSSPVVGSIKATGTDSNGSDCVRAAAAAAGAAAQSVKWRQMLLRVRQKLNQAKCN